MIEKRTCRKCNTEKDLKKDFTFRKYPKKEGGYYGYSCKQCKNKKSQEWKKKNKQKLKVQRSINYFKSKDGYHRVYLLKDYNYVGCTERRLVDRFWQHKSEFGRDCSNYEILFKSKDRDEALEVEAQYHDMGYEGKHSNNLYK